MMVYARSAPNIALIKYWGNRNDALRLPAADSLSMTLAEPTVTVGIEHAETLEIRSSTMGTPRAMTPKDTARFVDHLNRTKQYLHLLGAADALPANMAIQIDSHIPPAVGLASSAAVFSALAEAIRQLLRPQIHLTDRQTSVIARLGSGSACRSILGGFVAMEHGESDAIDAAAAVQIAPENHWPLWDVVIIPDMTEKHVGSTEGHAGAWSSPLFDARLQAITARRQRECIDAILERDFEKLRAVAEEDAWDMHRVMESQQPALRYLTDDTRRITAALESLRTAEHLPVLYTMDAGPTVHAICTEDALTRVKEFASAHEGCTLFLSPIGSGSCPA